MKIMKVQFERVLILGQGERGGTDYVLKSLADWLARNGYSVCYADSWDSIVKQNYSLIILPTSRMGLIPALGSKKLAFQCSKFIVWCMGSLAFHDAYYNGRKKDAYPKLLVGLFDKLINITSKTLLSDRSLVFTDEVGMYSDLMYLGDRQVDFSEIIFPIPVKSNALVGAGRFEGKAKSIAWVGRIDSDFKILPLIQLVEDSAIAKEQGCFDDNFTFIIVGSGNAMPRLRECISKYKEIHFELHEWLSQEELNGFILKRVDILFAMGSSALLGAALGVPTVIVQPYSLEGERKSANYRWIDETVGHSLGEFPGMFCKPDQMRKTFAELFDSLSLQSRSLLSRDFAGKFDEDLVFGRLVNRELPLDASSKTKFLLGSLHFLSNLKIIIKKILSIIRK